MNPIKNKEKKSIQEIIDNVVGMEAFLFLNNKGKITYQYIIKDSISNNMLHIASQIITTIFESNIETNYSKIKTITLQGLDKKIFITYLNHLDTYISIIGSNLLNNSIVQIYINKIAEIYDITNQ